MCSISANSIVGRYQHHVNRYCYRDAGGSKFCTHWLVPIISSVGTAILGSLDIVLCIIALPLHCSKAHLKNLAAAIAIVALAPFRMIINLFGAQSLPSLNYVRPYLCSKAPKSLDLEKSNYLFELNEPNFTKTFRESTRNDPSRDVSIENVISQLNKPNSTKTLLGSIRKKNPYIASLENVIFDLCQINKEGSSECAERIATADSPFKKLFHLIEAPEYFVAAKKDFFILHAYYDDLLKELADSVVDLNQLYQGQTILARACKARNEYVVQELLKLKAMPNEQLYDNLYDPTRCKVKFSDLAKILKLLLNVDKDNLVSKGRLLKKLLIEHRYLSGDYWRDYAVRMFYRDIDLMAELLLTQGVTTELDSIYDSDILIIEHLNSASFIDTPNLYKMLLEYGYKMFPKSIENYSNEHIDLYGRDVFKFFFPYISIKCESRHYRDLFKAEKPVKVQSIIRLLYLHSQNPEEVGKAAIQHGAIHGHLRLVREYLPKVNDKSIKESAFLRACTNGQDLIVEEMLNNIGPEITRDSFIALESTTKPPCRADVTPENVAPSPAFYCTFVGSKETGESDWVVEILLKTGLSVPFKPYFFDSKELDGDNKIEFVNCTIEINQCVAKLKEMVMPIFEQLRDSGFIVSALDNIVFDYLAFPVKASVPASN